MVNFSFSAASLVKEELWRLARRESDLVTELQHSLQPGGSHQPAQSGGGEPGQQRPPGREFLSSNIQHHRAVSPGSLLEQEVLVLVLVPSHVSCKVKRPNWTEIAVLTAD